MNSEEFREFGKAAIDFIADYHDTVRQRQVLPSVQPGYLASLVPGEMPEEGEDWRHIMRDMNTVIMPGITHWQSPHFHAFYPSASSFPSILGELLSTGLGVLSFTWLTSPASTELEVLVMNWLGKALGLPEEFLNCSKGPGGGVIQGTASESIMVSILAAKRKKILDLTSAGPTVAENDIKSRLVAYASDQSNSSVEKSAIIGDVPVRQLRSDDNGVLRGDALLTAVKEDLAKGLIPCCLVATLGTTGTCAFDNLEELGPICQEYNIWLHVDAAYAGSALLLPEYAHLKRGLEYVDSFAFNAHKWLLTNHDCSAMWVKNANHLTNTFFTDRVYLKHTDAPMNTQSPDYTHWQTPLSRRFRALKLWMTLRSYGLKGLQAYLRKHISLAKKFADLVEQDDRFELVCPPSMGLGDNDLTNQLYERLMSHKQIYIIKASFQGRPFLRFVVTSPETNQCDVAFAWNEISHQSSEMKLPRGGSSVAKRNSTVVTKELTNGHANSITILNGNPIFTEIAKNSNETPHGTYSSIPNGITHGHPTEIPNGSISHILTNLHRVTLHGPELEHIGVDDNLIYDTNDNESSTKRKSNNKLEDLDAILSEKENVLRSSVISIC
ncbi:hypothetical protein M8J75_003915 [Diaphorina citri]|nr:hypothetical protein M8J75_003915 [Diaphorina citri]